MTVATTASREQYATDGVTTAFTIHFAFFDDTDVNAAYVDGSGNATTLALSTDFSVTGGSGAGGTLTTTAALGSGGTLTIFRSVPFTQEDDYVEDDPLPADTLEEGFDRAVMRDQQIQDALDRSLAFPVTVGADVSVVLPSPVPGAVLAFARDGKSVTTLQLPSGQAIYASTADTNLGIAANEAVTPAGLSASKFNAIGKHVIPIDGAAMVTAATNGASVVSAEDGTNKHNRRGLSFSNATQQFACFDLPWPKSADEGTITFQYEWDYASSSGNVEFAVEAVGIGDGDTEDVAYGTAVSIIDTGLGTGKRHISAPSAALTIGGPLAEGDTVQFRLKRIVTTSGNLAAAAVVRKLRLFITTNAGTDG